MEFGEEQNEMSLAGDQPFTLTGQLFAWPPNLLVFQGFCLALPCVGSIGKEMMICLLMQASNVCVKLCFGNPGRSLPAAGDPRSVERGLSMVTNACPCVWRRRPGGYSTNFPIARQKGLHDLLEHVAKGKNAQKCQDVPRLGNQSS